MHVGSDDTASNIHPSPTGSSTIQQQCTMGRSDHFRTINTQLLCPFLQCEHDDFLDWQAAAQAIADYSITATCFQEMNLQWTTPIT